MRRWCVVQGVIQGLAFAHGTLPASRFYTKANILVVGNILIAGVGRFVAPPVARLLLQLGGRDAYAGMQLGLGCLSLGSCVLVAPAVRLLLAVDATATS